MTDNPEVLSAIDEMVSLSKELDMAKERLKYCESKMLEKDLKINNLQHRLVNITNIIDGLDYEFLNSNTFYTARELKESWSWFSKIKDEASGL